MRARIDGGQLKILSDDEVESLHLGVLNILKDIGVRIEHEGALKLLDQAGADVDFGKKVVKLPEHLVNEAIAKTPKDVTFYGRDPDQSFEVRGGKGVYFGECAGNPHITNENDQRKHGELADMGKVARLADALPNIDFVMGLTSASDVPTGALDLYEQFAVMSNTQKHVQIFVYNGGAEMTKAQIELAALLSGGEEELRKRPTVTFYIEPVSPLVVGEGYVDALIECAKLKLPMIFASVPVSSATCPATLAGSIVQGVAESLIGDVIGQLINPGTPFILGPVSTIMEMKRGMSIYTSIEAMMMQVMIAQLLRYYRIPSWGTAGMTDSKILDEQATAEAAMGLTISALSGNNIIHDLAFLESAKGGSMALLAIADEIVGMLRRFMKGARIDDETLALDAIKSAGFGGSFLTLKHTLNTYSKEHIPADLFDRLPWDEWERTGSKSLKERAQEKVQGILREHEVEPLQEGVGEKAKEIIRRFES